MNLTTDAPVTETPPPKEMDTQLRTATSSAEFPEELPVTVIDARSSWSVADFQELWRFRELFYFLTLRDIKLRYKQTILGLGWSIFQPLATILVFVIFIGYMGKAAEGVENYTLFVIAGVLPWTFFSNAVVNSGNSLINNERLVTKVYFPRISLPTANVFAAVFDFSICLLLFAITAICFGVTPTWRLLLAPMIVGILAMLAAGCGILLSALIAAQRDFRYLLNFGVQLWMFATPCIYLVPSSIGALAKQWLVLNPVYGLILNFRASTLGTEIDWLSLGVSALLSVLVLLVAMMYFRSIERTLADTI